MGRREKNTLRNDSLEPTLRTVEAMSTITRRGWLGCGLSLIAWALMSIASTACAASGEPRALIGHTRGVDNIAFSADGEAMLSAGLDRTARIWRLADGVELAVLQHEGRVRFAAFASQARVLTISEIEEAGLRGPTRRRGVALIRCRWSVFQCSAAERSPRLLNQGDLGDVLSIDLLGTDAFVVDHRMEAREANRRGKSIRKVELRGLPNGDVRFLRELMPALRTPGGWSPSDRLCVALGATGHWAYSEQTPNGDTVVILDATGRQLFALSNADVDIDRLFASREGDLLGAVVMANKNSRQLRTRAVGIRIWNAATGTLALQTPLLFGWVSSVTFMADRRLGLVAAQSSPRRSGRDDHVF